MNRCDKMKETQGSSDVIREAFNNCAWICYNKLDRRYKNYWKIKRDKILERHLYKSINE